MNKFVCTHPWTHFEVNNPNGDVTMCCDNNTVLGNVNTDSLDEIWNGDGFQEIRRRMRDDGAHQICPHTCPVLNGFKTYQNLDWHDSMKPGSAAKKNAEQNDEEFKLGALVLKSMPRWMRFAYSYACNLDCYHCYQRDDATQNEKLPDTFLESVYYHSDKYQVIYFFGGEPFLYKPMTKMMADINLDDDCRYFLISNATLFTDDTISMLSEKNIGHFAISLDAATELSFDLLRIRGAKTSWDEVLHNVGRIAEMKRKKGFTFSISMTLNSVNFDEIERFIDLGISFDAEPLVMLVANPYETFEFQKDFLKFDSAKFDIMYDQIDRALEKVESRQFRESGLALQSLKRALKLHQRRENSLAYYSIKKGLRRIYRALPPPAQAPLRRYIIVPLNPFTLSEKISNFLGSGKDLSSR